MELLWSCENRWLTEMESAAHFLGGLVVEMRLKRVLFRFCEASMHTFLQDIRYALRQLRHSPGFALTAILTLTMAIGANVVVFGVLNALVLHPLPVPEAKRVYSIQPKGVAISYPNFEDIRDRNKT